MRVFAALLLCLLGMNAPADTIRLSEEQSSLCGSTHPLLARRLGRVTLDSGKQCLDCGNYQASNSGYFVKIAAAALNGDFLEEVKRQLRSNGLLDKAESRRISLQVNVLKMSHDDPDQKAGSTLTSTVTLEYVLTDGELEVLRVPITTQGQSNSVLLISQFPEALDSALKKNLLVFLLSTKAALEPEFASIAEPSIKAILKENKSVRSIMGYFVVGLGKAGGAISDTAGAFVDNMAEGLPSQPSESMYDHIQRMGDGGPNLSAQIATMNAENERRQMARAEDLRREKEGKIRAEREEDERIALSRAAGDAVRQQQQVRDQREQIANAEINRQQQQALQQQAQRQEQARKEQARKEQARKEEAERQQERIVQQQNDERARQKAAQQAVSQAQAAAQSKGESAKACVSASASKGKVTFTNNCGEGIFVIWCGDLTYSKRRCGDGPHGGFFTESENIAAGDSRAADIAGQYHYGACEGGISFGNDGNYADDANGNVTCLKKIK